MKVIGLDGRTYNWPPPGHTPKGGEDDGSGLHNRTRQLLMSLFPNEPRLEEVPLPGSGKLTVDFYLPAHRLVVEANGRQHYEFVMHFHQTRLGFIQSLQRDQKKREWCERNNLRVVDLPYNESDDQWTSHILAATQDGGAAST